MNKVYHLVLILITCFGIVLPVSAQINKSTNTNFGKEYKVPSNFETLKNNSDLLKNKRSESLWFDYIGDARNFGETYTYFTGSHMWPDSNAVKPFDAGPEHAGTHGGGMMFDPTSGLWSANASNEWTRHTRYTIDSALILYKYFNFSSKKDSVVITLSTSENVSRLTFNSEFSTASVEYDPTTNKVVNANKEMVIYLDSTNNTSGFFTTEYSSYLQGGFEFPVGLEVTPNDGEPIYGNLFGLTIQFFHHRDATLGEVMTYKDSTNLDTNNLSLFSLLNMRGEGVTISDVAHNFGLYLYTNQRYSDRDKEWFYPNNYPNSKRFYNYILFKITGNNVGINKVNEDVYFALNPNPANRSEPFYADFKLTKPSKVEIFIADLQGRVVKKVVNDIFVPGQHNIDASLLDLKPGVYLYNIKTNHGQASKKFIVN